jgi:hypothetical protein
VINVSWDDAKQYVAWLEKKSGYPYRLLTEAIERLAKYYEHERHDYNPALVYSETLRSHRPASLSHEHVSAGLVLSLQSPERAKLRPRRKAVPFFSLDM